MKNNSLLTVILVVVFTAAGFYGGTLYQKNQQLQNINGFAGAAGGRFAGGNGQQFAGRRNGMGQVLGTIVSQDSSSMTVKLADGSSKIILLSGSTTYNQSSPATASDLKVGNKVAVFGTTNSDGSVTATNVSLNPVMRAQGERPTGTAPNGVPGQGQ